MLIEKNKSIKKHQTSNHTVELPLGSFEVAHEASLHPVMKTKHLLHYWITGCGKVEEVADLQEC